MPQAPAPPDRQPVAFVDLTVIPMDSERVIPHQTVLIRNGRVDVVGSAGDTPIPSDARVIDGRGKYLAPGLADMHVHFMGDENELLLYVANGVTTVRELSGQPEYLTWRSEITRGERVGPNLFVGSPVIDGAFGKRALAFRLGGVGVIALTGYGLLYRIGLRRIGSRRRRRVGGVLTAIAMIGVGLACMATLVPYPDRLARRGWVDHWYVSTPMEAARSVHRAAQDGYDQIKLYEHLSRNEFFAAIHAAKEQGLHTVGHVPFAVGLWQTAASGMDELAHVYFLVEELPSPGSALPDSTDYRRRIRDIASRIRDTGIDVISTLMPLPELHQQLTDSGGFFARADLRYRPPRMVRAIRTRLAQGDSTNLQWLEYHMTWGPVAAAELVRAGVPLVFGTDTSPRDVVAGFSALEELSLMARAGLTPYQALRTATVNASRVAGTGKGDGWGSIAVGKRADLLLLDHNPLENIAALQAPRGVMVAGRWYNRAVLDSLLNVVATRRAGS